MKKQRGITLIALIITIIVMLILVGVTVTVALDGGLFNTANHATRKMTMEQIKERAEMIRYTLLAEIKSANNNVMGAKVKYIEKLKKEFGENNVTVIGNKVIIEDKYDIKILNSNLDIEVEEHSDNVNLISFIYTTNNTEINEKNYYVDIIFTINKNTDEEYDKNDLNLYIMQNGNRTEIGTNLSVGDTIEYSMDKNGEYQFILENGNKEKVDFEILNIKNLEPYYEAEKIWETDSKGTVTAYLGEKTSVIIPKYIGNEKITATKATFKENAAIEEIIIPNTITNIGEYTFYKCSSLEKITIPNSVKTIGDWAFGRTSLIELEIPSSVIAIGIRSFIQCDELTKLIIPESVKTIGEAAFIFCDGLTEVTIPNSVTFLAEQAFRDCVGLEKVTLSNSMNSIEKQTFSGCTNLKEISIPNSIVNIMQLSFSSCKSLEKIVIPNSVKTINDWAFNYCDSLREIVIANSVTKIGSYALGGCSNIKVTFEKGTNSVPSGFAWGATNATLIDLNETATEPTE